MPDKCEMAHTPPVQARTQPRNRSRKPVGLAVTILFVLMAEMGYAISRHVEGAVSVPDAAEEQDVVSLPPECTAGGLTFADCFLDF